MLSELVSSSLIAAVKLVPASLHCSAHYTVFIKHTSAFSKTVWMYETRLGAPLAQDHPPDILNVQNFTQPDFGLKKCTPKRAQFFQNLNSQKFAVIYK